MRKFAIGLLMMQLFLMSSCTYSVIMTTKAGQGSDTVEDTATASPDVSPDIQGVPGLPNLTAGK